MLRDPEIRRRVLELSEVRTTLQVKAIACDWAMIALTIAGVGLVQETWIFPIAYCLGICVIAARQHALLVMMHEGAHHRISKNTRLNDFITNVFTAYPILISIKGYRDNHIAHHRHTNTDRDPDWARKIHAAEWQFPQTPSTLRRNLFRFALRGGLDWVLLVFMISKRDWKKGLFWLATIATVIATGSFLSFLAYWMVPLLTVLPVIQRLRSVSEHFGLARTHELDSTRTVRAGLVERFFLSPHNVGYHLEHHLFPSVPQYALPHLHEAMKAKVTFSELAHVNRAYLFGENSVWYDLTHDPRRKVVIETGDDVAA